MMPKPKSILKPQRFLWLSWKDWHHPGAGGDTVVMHELARRLVADGHTVTILTARYGNAPAHEMLDGIEMIRLGHNRYVHSFQALWYYLRRLRNRYDVLIEVVNTAPYFAVLFPGQAKPVLFYHQLAREIWFYETAWPLSWLGYYILEPSATRLLGQTHATTLTVSKSSQADLERFGFALKHLHIITEGIHLTPLPRFDTVAKYPQPTLLSLGALRSMKRTLDHITAFEQAKKSVQNLQLIVAGGGDGPYVNQVFAAINASPYHSDITYAGRVGDNKKRELMQRCHLLLVTSLKEGWGLVVSEANSQGTPAVVYDVDGLRDSVRHNQTGVVCDPNPASLAKNIVTLLDDPRRYNRLRRQAYDWSHSLTFTQTYADFLQALPR